MEFVKLDEAGLIKLPNGTRIAILSAIKKRHETAEFLSYNPFKREVTIRNLRNAVESIRFNDFQITKIG